MDYSTDYQEPFTTSDQNNSNRVLLHDLVLEKIFMHLVLGDVKCCRVVCSKWNSIANKYFIRQSVCCIRNTELSKRLNTTKVKRDLQLFNEHFPDPLLFQFSKFRIEGRFLATDLEKFFKYRPFIKELTLNYIIISNDGRNSLKSYDLSNWPGLKLFALHSNFPGETELVVPLSYITTIQTLQLREATVIFNGRIAPTTVQAAHIRCVCQGTKLDNHTLNLNDYINVRNLKELNLYLTTRPKFRLDLTHCCRLERLGLFEAHLLGWNNHLTLRTLDIVFVRLNLSELPPSVEELNLDKNLIFGRFSSSRYLQYSSSDRFLHLKSLKFCGDLPWLSQCPNLIRIVLEHDSLNLNCVPASVRTIVIPNNCEIVGGEQNVIPLDKLVFNMETLDHEVLWERVNIAIERLNPAAVVFVSQFKFPFNHGVGIGSGFHMLLTIIDKQMKKGGAVVLKRVQCQPALVNQLEHGDWGRSLIQLMESVSTCDYNVCRNGISKRIDKEEFDDWQNNYF